MISKRTIGSVLDETRGVGQGFNLLRFGLSLCVIFIHSFSTAYGLDAERNILERGALGPIVALILVLFFGLSGFLVTGSALRAGKLAPFLSFRALRLLPALSIELVLSAVFLGAIVTTLPVGIYYSNPEFWSYFGNLVGWIHFHLPGVFTHNPRPDTVNNSLWTLHPELECYAIMSLLIITTAVRRRTAITIGWAMVTLAIAILNIWKRKYELQGIFVPTILVYYFLTGIVAYHWRHKIPFNSLLFGASCVTAYILLKLPHTVFLVQFPAMYAMMYLGLVRFPKWTVVERGDYSYGMYLYGYPIQQTISWAFPWSHHWYIIFPMATIITYCFAALSWHFIEKPMLRLKRIFDNKRPTVSIPVETFTTTTEDAGLAKATNPT